MKGKLFASWVCLLVFLMSCEQKTDIIIPTPAEKTVLVYLAADNNIGRYVQSDLDEIMRGVEENPLPVSQHLVIYDDRGGAARLYEVVYEDGKATEKTIKTYPDRNSTGLDETLEVFNDVFNNPLYEAESYGLVYWSHAEGWIPYPLPSSRWIGQDTGDGDNRMNLSEFKQVLDAAPHFDFILFDACFMQSIEVAYELRNYTDYYIASPPETPGTGAPYDAILPYMFKKGAAKKLAEAYYNVYAELYNPERISDSPWTMGAAICVSETACLETLAAATRAALQTVSVPLDCADLRQKAFNYDQRSTSSSLYVGYYDLADIMQESLEEDVYAGWKRAFDDAVTYYTTPTNYSAASDGWFVVGNFSMEGTYGVTHYLPLSPDAAACEPYHTLEWYNAAGIAAMGW